MSESKEASAGANQVEELFRDRDFVKSLINSPASKRQDLLVAEAGRRGMDIAVLSSQAGEKELADTDLESVVGGLGIGYRFTFGHTVYEAEVGVDDGLPYGRVRAIASA
jgi:hypothetical protein